MTVTDDQARAITYLAAACRPKGAPRWDERGIFQNVMKIADRNLAMVIEHVIRHASDPSARTTGVIAGSFTPAAVTVPTSVVPKREEACGRCGGFRGACPCSRVESFGDDTNPVTPLSKTEAIRAARAALVTAKHTEETQ
jgi:hypothetical protein